jgi:hypothetical protein
MTGLTISALWIVPQRRSSFDNNPMIAETKAQETQAVTFKGDVSYKGISFSFNPSLGSQVEAKTVPPQPDLEDKQAKLEGIPVEHHSFTFVGSKHESTFWQLPEIDVFRLADYQKGLNAAPIYSQGATETVRLLKIILSKQPKPLALKQLLAQQKYLDKNDMPLLVLLDAKQAFHVRLKYIDFVNGKGVLFLTQYNIETSLINNQGLAYVFQGLTNDNVHAVSAVFPVSASFLPEDFAPTSAKEYKPSKNFYLLPNESRQYQSYLKTVRPRLEQLPSEKFTPNLNLIEALIASLKIQE